MIPGMNEVKNILSTRFMVTALLGQIVAIFRRVKGNIQSLEYEYRPPLSTAEC